jgi:AraC-like DNA-binding protein
MRGPVHLGSCPRARTAVVGGRLLCLDRRFGAAGHWAAPKSKASGVSTNCNAAPNVRKAFSLSGKVQGGPECVGFQQSGYGTAIRDAQLGPARDGSAAARGRTDRATYTQELYRAGKRHFETASRWHQRPGIRDLARELHLSPRTLQRRLTEEGITFQRLLDKARRELARHYLLRSTRELNETAYLLGYEDANSFFRAFHHWEGTSPRQWRLLQKHGQLPTRTEVGTA